MNKPTPTNTAETSAENTTNIMDASGDLHDELAGGFIHSWLVAGPIKTPVHDLDRYRGADFKAQIAQAYFRRPQIDALAPAEGRKFEEVDPIGATHALVWQTVRCGDDHYINLSGFYHTCHYLTAWGYAKIAHLDSTTFGSAKWDGAPTMAHLPTSSGPFLLDRPTLAILL